MPIECMMQFHKNVKNTEFARAFSLAKSSVVIDPEGASWCTTKLCNVMGC